MFYRTEDGHGLPHNPFAALVAPRPIGWISTRGEKGDNLAPYSFFNAIAYAPPQVMFAGGAGKNSLANIRQTGVFAVNIVGRAALEAMNATSTAAPHGVDEFALVGVAKDACRSIDCPRVADAPATLECAARQIIDLEGGRDVMVIGTVLAVHIRDDCLRDGRFDPALFGQMGRLGGFDYTEVRGAITLPRPD